MRRLFLTIAAGFILIVGIATLIAPSPAEPGYVTERGYWQLSVDAEDAQATAASRQTATTLWQLVPPVGLAALLVFGMAVVWQDRKRKRDLIVPDDNGLYPINEARLTDRVAEQVALMLAGGAMTRAVELARASAMVPQHYAPHIVTTQHTTPAALALPAPAEQATATLPGATDLAQVLDTFTPSLNGILLGLGPNSTPITVPAGKIWNMAIAGPTGEGKSNVLKLIISQIQACGGRVVLADPKYCPIDADTGEDWRPIEQRLFMKPAVKYADIDELLSWGVEELDRRLELRRMGERVGPPMFLAVDELAAIVDELPSAPDKIARIIRMGRAVQLLTIGSATDWLVKTVGGSSGAREQFRSAYYLGGDLRTGAALLDMSQRDIDDGRLGQGVAMLRSKATPAAQLVRVPLVSNEALYQLLDRGSLISTGAESPGERAVQESTWKPTGTQPESIIDLVSVPIQRAETALNPEEARVIDLFRAGSDIPTIVKEVYGAAAGRKYQDASAQVQNMIRKAIGGAA